MTTAVELWDSQQKALIKDQIARDCTDDELRLFAQVCAKTGLDPFSRQIYAIKRNDRNAPGGKKMSIQVSIDGFRVVAERSREYEGQTPKQWCGPDAKWVDLWLNDEPPVAARAGVWRRGFREPLYMVALWKDYAQDSSPMWKKMGAHMLAKCAEAQALRAAFPADLSGLYTSDEMAQADTDRGAGALSTTPTRTAAATAAVTPRSESHAESRPTLPPVPIDTTTGEIIDAEVVPEPTTVREAQQAQGRTNRRFAPPSQSAQNTATIMAGFADADAVKATDELKARIKALDTWAQETLGDAWKKAGLPSIAGSGKALVGEQLTLASELVAGVEGVKEGAA